MEMHNESEAAIHFSVPQDWRRNEVRGVPIVAVTAEAPAAGYVRWMLPPSAEVQWIAPHLPHNLLLEQPHPGPLVLHLTTVALDRDTAEHDTVIVTEAQYPLP